MKKTITALTLISLSIGVGMTADVNISATDLTEGEYNYIAIPQGENSTVVIDGLKEDQSLASVKRLYIGESLTGGDYTYGNISISVDNLKITERLYSFPFMDGAGTVSMGDIVFNVGSNVSSVQTYLGGQSWYSPAQNSFMCEFLASDFTKFSASLFLSDKPSHFIFGGLLLSFI